MPEDADRSIIRDPELKTSLSHRILAVVGTSFLCFEFLFLILFCDNSWFKIDISLLGIPIMLAVNLAVFYLLKAAETKFVCRILSPIWKGKPPVAFMKWVRIEQTGISFGIRQVTFEAMDELDLTILGNLIVKSWAICGRNSSEPDVVFKLPFGIADFKTQKEFLETIKQKRPSLSISKKLEKVSRNVILKGSQVVQLAGSLIMCLALMDFAYSSFYYLEILKNYHLSQVSLLASQKNDAQTYFNRAELLYEHIPKLSFATHKLILDSGAAAGLKDLKAEILWLQGRRKEAIAEQKLAITLEGNSSKRNLHLIRLLADNGEYSEAKQRLLEMIKKHDSSLNPRLYLLSLIQEKESKEELSKAYKTQMDECYKNVFGDEPRWPPGGNRFYDESIYSEDLRFLLNRFLKDTYQVPKSEQKKE